jgi:hypothetical protein
MKKMKKKNLGFSNKFEFAIYEELLKIFNRSLA